MSCTYCHTHSKYDCQTCADEILSLGIQADKDRIAALESEVARLEACAAQAEPEEKIDFEKLESLGWQIAICAMCGTHAAAIKPAQSVPVEVFDSHCNYASFAGRVCNKCGRIHDGGKSVAVVGEPVAWVVNTPIRNLHFSKSEEIGLGGATQEPLFRAPTHSIPAADLATLREKAAEADELRKDAENWRNRHEVSK